VELLETKIVLTGPLHVVTIPLTDSSSIEPAPNGFKGSIRLFGVGGLFGYTGLYWSKSVGRFTAYVTNRGHSILIKSDSRQVMISPDDVEGFMLAVNRRRTH
jgi:hypothetical protein